MTTYHRCDRCDASIEADEPRYMGAVWPQNDACKQERVTLGDLCGACAAQILAVMKETP